MLIIFRSKIPPSACGRRISGGGEDDLDAPDLGAGAKIVADPPSGNENDMTPEDGGCTHCADSEVADIRRLRRHVAAPFSISQKSPILGTKRNAQHS